VLAENSESSEKSGDFVQGPVVSPACSPSSQQCSPGSLAESAAARN
jgi:hypothetical protein